jgi:flagellar protein FlaI
MKEDVRDMLNTKIDDMVGLLEKHRGLNYGKIAKKLKWNEDAIEKIAIILEKNGLAQTHYPINMLEKPWATLLPAEAEDDSAFRPPKVIDQYDISVKGGHIHGKVKIYHSKEDKRPAYHIEVPRISPYARAYLEYVKVEVSKDLPLYSKELTKEDSVKHFEAMYKSIEDMIKQDLNPDSMTLKALSDIVINEMHGLGKLEALIGDGRLEEIIINHSKLPVAVYHRKFGWLKTNIYMNDEVEIENFAEQIARKVGRQISTLSPVLDAHLRTGDRANATLYPISTRGNTMTLRLFARNPWTIISYLRINCLSKEMAAVLWQAMQYEMNVLIAGGTASGKTSALNSLLALIQPFQRIVSIEDTRELMLPTYQWNWIPMVTRAPNPEGFGEVTMLDLVVNSLRMRPDRIAMGEIRRRKEAEVLFEAMHTGHSVYSTIHADTGTQVLKRLIEPPIEVPAAEVEDIHLLLVQYRDRRKNIRRTLELSEVVPGVGSPELNRIFNWKPRTDTFQMVKTPHRYVEQMNLHTGMTEKEILEDQKKKMKLLEWMDKEKLDTIDEVGRVMKAYYADEPTLVKAAEKGEKPSKVL